jgi:transcription termination factor NusB
VPWQQDAELRQRYLDELWSFARRLSPAHNSLKAHVLHHRLWHDLRAGTLDRDRFMEYLRLPRRDAMRRSEFYERLPRGDALVNGSQSFPTGMSSIGDDRPLLRAYLQQWMVEADGYADWARYLNENWLKRLFAETKILAGVGDMERWYSMLAPSELEALKNRVEILFPPTQKLRYRANDAVSIAVDVKNVEQLIVKIFEIDTFAYERDTGKEVNASIDLDGIVANEERSYSYDESPLRRVRRSFDFAGLQQPGTYVVEFLGNGISSRAVIRKGRLRYTERNDALGQVLNVFDEDGDPVLDAAAWCGGKQYAANEKGEIVLPYVAKAASKPLILRRGRLTSLEKIQRLTESYVLSAGVYVQREALLPPFKAKLLVRPSLTLHGVPISPALVDQAELVISAQDLDGVRSTMTVRDLQLSAGEELVHEIQVPERMRSLAVFLRGRVESMSLGKKLELRSQTAQFELNRAAETAKTSGLLLGRGIGGWFLDLRGRSGEPRAGVPVKLELTHRHFTRSIDVTLQTDANGRIQLGSLPGIVSIQSSLTPGAWQLRRPRATQDKILTGVVGATLRVPTVPTALDVQGRVSLLERSGGSYVRDASAKVSRVDGFIVLRDLEAGDYSLWIPELGEEFSVKITAGQKRAGWAVGPNRMLQLSGENPLQVIDATSKDGKLQIQLEGARKGTRVHVFATRWLPAYDGYQRMLAPRAPIGGEASASRPESSYFAGRKISDEYRYILGRRYEKQYPGNMLGRPGLLLNPWELPESADMIGVGGGAGGQFGGRAGGRRRMRSAGGATGGESTGAVPGTYVDVDFLPEPSRLLANLRPNEQGVVELDLRELGQGQHVHVVAVDPFNTATKSILLPEQVLEPRDRSLSNGLDPRAHVSEQRSIDFVQAGEEVVIEDITTTKLESYASLADIYQLLQTLSGNGDLARFEFLTRWPSLKNEDKMRLYSEHACHELHLFVYMKDRSFFDEVIRPYLANKVDKTFVDHWLLDADLREYLAPWKFSQLNVVEQILLAMRLPEQKAAVARRLRELQEMQPSDGGAEDRLFAAALAGRALETQGSDLAKLSKKLRENLKETRKAETKSKRRAAPKPSGRPSKDARNEKMDEPAESPMEEVEESLEKESADDEDAAADRLMDRESLNRVRKTQRALYRELGRTLQYAENNYWHVPIARQNAGLITANGFWRDFAMHDGESAFCSRRIGEATRNLSEMLLALAVIDLPFVADAPEAKSDGPKLALRAKTPLLLVRKELRPAPAAEGPSPVLISQNFFRLDDRYRYEGDQRLDKFVTDEFLVHMAYGCQVVLTNPSSSPRDLELLLQVPHGAVPLQRGVFTKGQSLRLAPFATRSFVYSFYFPRTGEFGQFPAHLAKEGRQLTAAAPSKFKVVAEPSVIDTTSWQHVSQDASLEDLLRYLDANNLRRLDLSKLAWRMRDKEQFESIVGKLRSLKRFDAELWGYGLLHLDEQAVREYLQASDFAGQCGFYLDSRLCRIDPVERRSFQLIEFDPLVNSRTHPFGDGRRILNRNLAGQYQRLLQILSQKPSLGSEDWMTVTYYLLLQDRITEALASFAKVDAEQLSSKLQYDYLQCYLDFYSDKPSVARRIAEKYREHPVQRWRQRFANVLNQLDEAEGKNVKVSDTGDRTQSQTQLAATEPELAFEIDEGQLRIGYQNLTRCTVSYYELDVEFSFSAKPFVTAGRGGASYVRPNKELELALPAGKRELLLQLPDEYRKSNVRIVVSAGGISREQSYLSNSLAVQFVESYGQLQVRRAGTGKLMPKVYVKVYALMRGGRAVFHKDGYTDLRGRFDYASTSARTTVGAQRYAILVLSDEDGAVIREVTPPGR